MSLGENLFVLMLNERVESIQKLRPDVTCTVHVALKTMYKLHNWFTQKTKQNKKGVFLVRWYFESSQSQRITSRLETMFSLSPIYSACKSSNHTLSKPQVKEGWGIQAQNRAARDSKGKTSGGVSTHGTTDTGRMSTSHNHTVKAQSERSIFPLRSRRPEEKVTKSSLRQKRTPR